MKLRVLASLPRKLIPKMLFIRKFGTLPSKLGFIGLGKMGLPMSLNLFEKYNDLIVYDINKAALSQIKDKVKIAEKMNDFKDCDFVFTMLPDFNSTYNAIFSNEGLANTLKKGSTLINCGTIGITESIDLMRQLGNDFDFIDAPVSGGTIGAEKRSLTFMVGGNEKSAAKISQYLLTMGQNIVYLGEVGKGQAAKICNNLLLATNMIGAAEAFALAKLLDLDLNTFSNIVNSSSGRSWVTELNNPVPNIVSSSPSSKNYEGGFSSSLLLKDLKLALNAAIEKNLNLKTLESTHSIYSKMIDHDHDAGSKDMSYIFQYIHTKSNKP